MPGWDARPGPLRTPLQGSYCQEGAAANSFWSPYRQIVSAVPVRNAVARLAGTDSTRTVALVSHCDSVPGSPGAADSGAALGVQLGTVRALVAGGVPRNDLVVLFP